MTKEIYLDREIKWEQSSDIFYPYYVQFNNNYLQIRLNDFPAEPHYSFLMDGKLLFNFDDWPPNWERDREWRGTTKIVKNYIESAEMKSIKVKNVQLINNDTVTFVCEYENLTQINLNDITTVVIETTDSGPIEDDFFMVLINKNIEIKIPGSEGKFNEILNRLQQLNGFNNELFIEACSCVKNKRFVCWENK